MLRLKVNTKLLQQRLRGETGKVVILKDVRNIQTGIHAKSEKNNLEALVARLRKIHGKQSICNLYNEHNTCYMYPFGKRLTALFRVMHVYSETPLCRHP